MNTDPPPCHPEAAECSASPRTPNEGPMQPVNARTVPSLPLPAPTAARYFPYSALSAPNRNCPNCPEHLAADRVVPRAYELNKAQVSQHLELLPHLRAYMSILWVKTLQVGLET